MRVQFRASACKDEDEELPATLREVAAEHCKHFPCRSVVWLSKLGSPGHGGSLLQPRLAKKSVEGGDPEAQEGWELLQGSVFDFKFLWLWGLRPFA